MKISELQATKLELYKTQHAIKKLEMQKLRQQMDEVGEEIKAELCLESLEGFKVNFKTQELEPVEQSADS